MMHGNVIWRGELLENIKDHNADVAVIEAGLSGLSAAKILHERGLNAIVLEARDRVGGRTYTLRNEDVTYVDLGGSYVGPTQNRILRLADEFGIQTFLTQDTEDLIFHSKGRSKKITGAVPPVSGLLATLDVNNLFREIDEMGEEIPVDAPWDAPHAEEWDKMTVKEFFNQTIWTKGAWKLGEQTVNVCVTSESHEVSLLWFLWYLRQCGGSNRILSTDNGGQCRHVILAVPLPLQTRLTFDPPLPSLRNQLIQRVPMGSVIKTFVYYDRPFWQEKGHSGTAIIEDEEALVEFTFADTKPDSTKPAIMGLILAGRAKTCVALTKEERRDRICKLYARVFDTDQALKWVHYEELNWLAEQWSGGCYSAMMPPGFLTTFGRELRKPVGRIHFAGTETATEWSGYMEGAVQAGERAAREILFERGEINQSEIWKEEPENKVIVILFHI
ncbi:hypothetical protein FSP39_015503 [Pinctada imbricata]|uniref:Amine oxidase n=1 Tax=Pinctada imbricata TaxID=66713 RepID=A0AA88XVT4_PINIB|nr:hypothetical protein FSP39_015503 [Pinctada imbricata]